MERRKLAIQVSTANPEHAQNLNNKDRSTSRVASTWRHSLKKPPIKQTNKQTKHPPAQGRIQNGNMNVQNRSETRPLEL